jgi:transcriptional regulator with XRE-family HTH domain
MKVQVKIGLRIKQLREKAGMSQKDLSFTANLDRSYIASVESAQRNISIVNIEKIAKALNVSIRHFFPDPRFDKH